MYYFDNSATTLKKPSGVAEAVYHAIADEQLGNPARGSHDAALNALRLTESVRQQVAALFGVCDASHVSFMPNATTALNTAIRSLLSPEDHILTTVTEHNAVLRPLYQLEERGAKLSFVPVDEDGILQYQAFEELLRPDTRAVVINHASNVTGNVVDLDWIGRFCQKHRLLLIVDAAQSAGILEINMEQQHIDALCFTGHKSLYGPQGIGGLCLGSKTHQLKPVFTGGSGFHSFDKQFPTDLPTVFEPGTQNVHGLAGLKAGLSYVNEHGLSALRQEVNSLAADFAHQIKTIPGVQLYGKYEEQTTSPIKMARVPVVSLNLTNWSSGDLSDALFMDHDIAVRPGAHCAPLIHQALGTEKQGMVRFSFSSFNTTEEVTHAVKALQVLAKERM